MTQPGPGNTFSRRYLLKGAAALACTRLARGEVSAPATGAKRTLAYVGTYTGAMDAGSNGEGIYRFDMDRRTGELSGGKLAAKTASPSWIEIHPTKKYLYAVNEVANFHGNRGSVSAFAIDPAGDLHALNTVDSEGAGPAYLSIDPSGKYAFVANYGGGSLAVLPILPDGSLAPAEDVHHDIGSLGNTQATDAPPGSFAVSGHDAPHIHMIATAPGGTFVLATDLGQDRIYIYRLNRATGKLTLAETEPFASLPSGDGPRHFVFHPNGYWLYSVQEESSTIAFFRYEPGTGSLTFQQTISTLPSGFAGTSFASEILVSSDGRFLYAANRLHNSIAIFAIAGNGKLRLVGEAPSMGDYPSQCRIAPGGDFFYACNRRSDNITTFRIHRDTGLLAFTGQYTPVGSPGSITFLQ